MKIQPENYCIVYILEMKKKIRKWEGISIAVKRVTYHYELIDRVAQTISNWAGMTTGWTLKTCATQKTVSRILYAKNCELRVKSQMDIDGSLNYW